MLHLVKVRVDVARLAEFGRRIANREFDGSSTRWTFCIKADPTVGYSLWETADAAELERKLGPYRPYYREVEIAEVVSPQEAMALIAAAGADGRTRTCSSLEEVRACIDDVDRRLVAALAQRHRYVLQAARFKQTDADVRAPARVEQVIAKVRALAGTEGVDPDLVEALYRQMIDRFIELEAAAQRSS